MAKDTNPHDPMIQLIGHILVHQPTGTQGICGGYGLCQWCTITSQQLCPMDGAPCFPGACCAPVAGHPRSIAAYCTPEQIQRAREALTTHQ